MSDTASIVEGLTRLAGSLDGLPLLGTKSIAGAFPATRAGREAATFCQGHALVRLLRTETVGRASVENCTISDAGIAWILEHAGAASALEGLAQAVQPRSTQLSELQRLVKGQQEQLAQLTSLIEELAQKARQEATFANGCRAAEASILAELGRWQHENPLKDCSLPELYGKLRADFPRLTIGEFHDACRNVTTASRIYLHPWTGPLYEMPEPALAFLFGHEIAYYASLREPARTALSSPTQREPALRSALI